MQGVRTRSIKPHVLWSGNQVWRAYAIASCLGRLGRCPRTHAFEAPKPKLSRADSFNMGFARQQHTVAWHFVTHYDVCNGTAKQERPPPVSTIRRLALDTGSQTPTSIVSMTYAVTMLRTSLTIPSEVHRARL